MHETMLTGQAASHDSVRVGNYEVVHCGDQLHKVRRILQYTHDTLSQLIQDPDHPTVPQERALKTFMNGVPVSEIKAMFQQIVDGAAIPIEAKPGSPPKPPEILEPRIVCIDPHIEALKPFQEECQKHPKLLAFHIRYSPYIFLCPLYGQVQLRFGFRDCPTEDGANKIRGKNIHNSQFAILVHELVHFYYGNGRIRQPEVYLPNLLVDLPPGEAQWNPSNWGWLVAGKSLQVSTVVENSAMEIDRLEQPDVADCVMLVLAAGCTDYPRG